MTNDLRRKFIRDALQVWAPNFPRRINRHQHWVNSHEEAVENLLRAEDDSDNSPFVSVYSFPDGHTKKGNIPRLDTIFIDFDIEDGDYVAGSGDVSAWRRDLSKLLVRARRVAEYIRDNGAAGWRASLSGHKGIHLFLDFPPIEQVPGSYQEVVAGLNDYTGALIDHIQDETGIDGFHRFVDVTSSDLGRMCRVPNTQHGGATASFGEARFCVPVTIEELAEITVDDYLDLTRAPRPVPYDSRTPNVNVQEAILQHIRMADLADRTVAPSSGSTVDRARVEQYKEESNDNIELEDIEFLTSDRPCVWRWHERDDKFRHGAQSHYMEVFCITELLEKKVPIDVIKDFLNSAPEYDAEYSGAIIEEVISRDYNRWSISTLLQRAPEFCGYDDCSLCQRVLADENLNT
jgi:hypothetical protein